ncbi:MAG: TlpA family protein disulfide reductase [Tannerella sp.]|jgi:peroxiredoxin|nr:TlpA family protein disulfide reductase [Tannerella sp.]
MTNFKLKKFYFSATAFGMLLVMCGNSLYAANGSMVSNAPVVTGASLQNMQEAKVGTPAPEFTLTSVDGKSVSLSDFIKGYVVVLNFWSSSSAESRAINAEIAGLEKKYENMDVVFIGVSLDENKADWQAAVGNDGLTGLQVSELKKTEDANIAKLYGVTSVPAVCIINHDGTILDIRNDGTGIDRILKEKFPDVNR